MFLLMQLLLALYFGQYAFSRSINAPCTYTIYAGALGNYQSYITISNDNGKTWQPTLVADAFYYGTLYSIAAAGDNVYVALGGAGLKVSNDSGKSYNLVDMGLPKPSTGFVQSVAVEENHIVAYVLSREPGVTHKIYNSYDNGRTWSFTSPALADSSDKVYDVALQDDDIYISTLKSGLGVYTQQTKRWTFITTRHGLATNDVNKFTIYKDSIFIATMVSNVAGMLVSVSENRGETWKTYKIENWNIHSISSIYTNDGKTIYVTTPAEGLYISKNAGRTWINKKATDGLAYDRTTSVLAFDNWIFVGLDQFSWGQGAISISNNAGATWETQNRTTGLIPDRINNLFGQCV